MNLIYMLSLRKNQKKIDFNQSELTNKKNDLKFGFFIFEKCPLTNTGISIDFFIDEINVD